MDRESVDCLLWMLLRTPHCQFVIIYPVKWFEAVSSTSAWVSSLMSVPVSHRCAIIIFLHCSLINFDASGTQHKMQCISIVHITLFNVFFFFSLCLPAQKLTDYIQQFTVHLEASKSPRIKCNSMVWGTPIFFFFFFSKLIQLNLLFWCSLDYNYYWNEFIWRLFAIYRLLWQFCHLFF